MKLNTSVFAKMKSLDKEFMSFSLLRKKAYVISDKFFGLLDLSDYLIEDDKEVLMSAFSVSNEFFLPLCETYPDGLTIAKSGSKDSFFHGKDKLKIPTSDPLIDDNLEETLNKLLEDVDTTQMLFDMTPFVSICKEAMKFGQSGLLFDARGIAARSPGKVYVYRFEEEYTGSRGASSVPEFFLPFEFVPFLEIASKTHARVTPDGQITLLLYKADSTIPFAAFALANAVEKDNRVEVAANFAQHDYPNSFKCKTQAFKDFMQLCKPVLANKDQIIPMEFEVSKTSVRVKLLNSDYGLDLDVDIPTSEVNLITDTHTLRFSAIQFEKTLSPFSGDITIGFYEEGSKKSHIIMTPDSDPRKFVILSQIVKRS